MYDIIVFENLCFCPSTRKREASVYKNLQSGERFWKHNVFGDQKISGFKQKRILVDGAKWCSIFNARAVFLFW